MGAYFFGLGPVHDNPLPPDRECYRRAVWQPPWKYGKIYFDKEAIGGFVWRVFHMSIADIESAIVKLPAKEFAELMVWIQEYHDRVWDQQIEKDLDSGRLDTLMAAADKEYRQGLAKPL
jgi:hypothetical protein